MIVVAKVGTSSITDGRGVIDEAAVEASATRRPCGRRELQVVVVTSGAVAAGLPELHLDGGRPREPVMLQAVSAVGQSRLMRVYEQHMAEHGLVVGQVLLVSLDFMIRQQYLHARGPWSASSSSGSFPS